MIRMTQLKSKAESHKVAEFVAMKEHTEVNLRSFDGRNLGSYAPTGIFEEPIAPSLSATLAVMLMDKVSGLKFLARTYRAGLRT